MIRVRRSSLQRDIHIRHSDSIGTFNTDCVESTSTVKMNTRLLLLVTLRMLTRSKQSDVFLV